MKLTKIATLCALLVGNSYGALYTLSNNSGPINTMPIVSSTGAFVNSGQVVIGSYLGAEPVLSGSSLTMQSILSSFTVLASGSLGTSGTGTATINGVFNIQTSGVDPLDNLAAPAAAGWLGKNFFVIAGNNAVLAESSEVLVFRFSNSTIGGTEPVTSTLSMRLGAAAANGTIFQGVGGFNNFVVDPTPGAVSTGQSAFNMVAVVPEPSVALLGVLGVFGLVRRRR